MTDFPCKCGHLENVHPPAKHYSGVGTYEVCDGCFKKNRRKGVKQLNTVDCREYKRDNLKYLEQIYESKTIHNR